MLGTARGSVLVDLELHSDPSGAWCRRVPGPQHAVFPSHAAAAHDGSGLPRGRRAGWANGTELPPERRPICSPHRQCPCLWQCSALLMASARPTHGAGTLGRRSSWPSTCAPSPATRPGGAPPSPPSLAVAGRAGEQRGDMPRRRAVRPTRTARVCVRRPACRLRPHRIRVGVRSAVLLSPGESQQCAALRRLRRPRFRERADRRAAPRRRRSDLCQRLDVARVQILASTEGDSDAPDDAHHSGGAPLSSAHPAGRPANGGGPGGARTDPSPPPGTLPREGGRGGGRGPEETLEGMRAACAHAPAWMLEVRCCGIEPEPFKRGQKGAGSANQPVFVVTQPRPKGQGRN